MWDDHPQYKELIDPGTYCIRSLQLRSWEDTENVVLVVYVEAPNLLKVGIQLYGCFQK